MLLKRSDGRVFPRDDPEWALISRLVVDYAQNRVTEWHGEIDWRRLLGLGARHCILPLLATQLVKAPAGEQLPGVIRKELVLAKQQNLERVLAMAAELQNLERLLQAAQIDYRLLKGLPLAARAYRNVVDRHVGDVDLLLMQVTDIDKVHVLLQDNGYEVISAHAQYDQKLRPLYFRLRKDNAYLTEDGQLLIEVHWPSGTVPAFPEALITALERGNGEVVESLGHKWQQPPLGELCDYLVWHGARAQWYRLKWLVDVYLLLQQVPPDPSWVRGHRKDTVAWCLVLELLRRMFGYDPDIDYPVPEKLVSTCLKAIGSQGRIPGYQRFSATLQLRRDWAWRRLVIRQHLIKLSDYQKLRCSPWVVYASFWLVRPVSWLYRRMHVSRSSA